MTAKKFIQSLEKGLLMLRTFSAQRPDLSLSEISTATGMSPGTVHRYLYTLETIGYIKQAPDTKRYWLTPKVLGLGFAAFRSMDLRKRVLPYMIGVANDLNVTVQCSILDGHEILFIERVRSKSVVDLDLSAGSRLPAYCTSQGKTLLAFMDEETTREIIEKIEMVPLTPYTNTDKDLLWEELKQVRKVGYATNNQELREGLFAIAAPIFKEGQVEAALGFSVPNNLIGKGNFKETLVERLLSITKKISIE